MPTYADRHRAHAAQQAADVAAVQAARTAAPVPAPAPPAPVLEVVIAGPPRPSGDIDQGHAGRTALGVHDYPGNVRAELVRLGVTPPPLAGGR